MMNTTHLRKTASAENEQPTMLDDIVLDRRQRDAYAQWLSLASDSHGTPLRSGFRPEQSRHAMPAGMLLHAGRSSGEMALWQRIEGRLVSLAFGEGDGQRLDTIYNAQFLAHFVPRLLETAITGLPCMTKDSVSTHSGEEFRYTRLILPFREECGDISRLFVVFGFEPAALSMLDEPLPVRRREADPVVEYHGSTKRRRA